LGEVETPRSSRQATRAAIDDLSVGYCASRRPPRSGLSRSDLVPWPEPEATPAAGGVRCPGSTCRRSVGPNPPLVTPRRRRGSFGFEMGCSDHLAQVLGFVGNELGEVGTLAPLKRILDLKNWQFFHTFIAEMHFMRRQSI
jgi:hypothetical protein